MNFLAHLYLAHNTPESQLGNVIADLIKGPSLQGLPAPIQAGVRQHRAVDGFTDRHPIVQRSITRISHNWGWFSGIIIDVYYDHLLARGWHRYSTETLREFADRMYGVISSSHHYLEDRDRAFFQRFIEEDRLVKYGTASGITETLSRISNVIAVRMPTRALRLEEAMPLLESVDDGLREDFHAFFPELIAFARAFPE